AAGSRASLHRAGTTSGSHGTFTSAAATRIALSRISEGAEGNSSIAGADWPRWHRPGRQVSARLSRVCPHSDRHCKAVALQTLHHERTAHIRSDAIHTEFQAYGVTAEIQRSAFDTGSCSNFPNVESVSLL